MAQREIIAYLKKHKTRWFTAKELSVLMKVGRGNINKAIAQLRRYYLVDFKQEGITYRIYYYRHIELKKIRI